MTKLKDMKHQLTFLTAGNSEYEGGPGQILSLGVPSSYHRKPSYASFKSNFNFDGMSLEDK